MPARCATWYRWPRCGCVTRSPGQGAAHQREGDVEQHAAEQHRHQQERHLHPVEPPRRHAQHGQHEAAELAADIAHEDARAGKIERQEADQSGGQQQRGEIDEPAALPLRDERQEARRRPAPTPAASPFSPSMKFIALVTNRIHASVAAMPSQPRSTVPTYGSRNSLHIKPGADRGQRRQHLRRQLHRERPVRRYRPGTPPARSRPPPGSRRGNTGRPAGRNRRTDTARRCRRRNATTTPTPPPFGVGPAMRLARVRRVHDAEPRSSPAPSSPRAVPAAPQNARWRRKAAERHAFPARRALSPPSGAEHDGGARRSGTGHDATAPPRRGRLRRWPRALDHPDRG